MRFLSGSSLLKSFIGKPLVGGRRFLSAEEMRKFSMIEVEELKPFVYSVAINRPSKRNSLNTQGWAELESAFNQLSEDPHCRVVILSGNGKMFSSGIDVNDLMQFSQILTGEDDAPRKARKFYDVIIRLQKSVSSIEKCQKPVIGAIHNGCVGGAVDLICSADIRYCSQDSYFQIKEVDLGLAADIGTLQRLPKIIGSSSLVNDLCFTGRKMLSDEALNSGFVSKVFPDKENMMDEATKMAELIASKSPVAVQSIKENIIYSRDHGVDESLEHMARWNSLHLQTEDLMKAAMATMTKAEEPPEFANI